jgi:hypothetical protein
MPFLAAVWLCALTQSAAPERRFDKKRRPPPDGRRPHFRNHHFPPKRNDPTIEDNRPVKDPRNIADPKSIADKEKEIQLARIDRLSKRINFLKGNHPEQRREEIELLERELASLKAITTHNTRPRKRKEKWRFIVPAIFLIVGLAALFYSPLARCFLRKHSDDLPFHRFR